MYETKSWSTTVHLPPSVTSRNILSTLVPSEILTTKITPNPLHAEQVAHDESLIAASALAATQAERDRLRCGEWYYLSREENQRRGTAELGPHRQKDSPTREAWCVFVMVEAGTVLHSFIPGIMELVLSWTFVPGDRHSIHGAGFVLRQDARLRSNALYTEYYVKSVEKQWNSLVNRMTEKAIEQKIMAKCGKMSPVF